MYARYKEQVVCSQKDAAKPEEADKTQISEEFDKINIKEGQDYAAEYRNKYPHLTSMFDIIDGFVAELKENPPEFSGQYTMLQLQLMFIGENDRNVLGDYFSKTEAAKLMKETYNGILKSLEVPCMAALPTETLQKNVNDTKKLAQIREVITLNAYNSFGEKLCSEGLLGIYVEDLKVVKVEDVKTENEELLVFFDSFLSTLHNYLTNPAIRQPLREYDTVTHLLPFLKCEVKVIKLLTLCTLAKLVDETENEHLLADDSVFDVLFDITKAALKDPHHVASGWTLRALIKGMAGLAKNDTNKTVLYEKGAVPILMEVMKTGNDVEKERATGCIWELAFDKTIREKLAENEELMNVLTDLKTSTKDTISKPAKGALWEIQHEERAQNRSGAAEGGHVMISYQWADQQMMLKIKDSLCENGFKVWMDVVNMSESTLEAMAKAVEDAAVVLVCMSERYKLSQNCWSEAEYAFSLKKKIIPLLMQRNYVPDGWLGMIKGTKLFFDFSGKYPYDDKLEGLLRELGQDGKKTLQTTDGSDAAVLSMTQSFKMMPLRGQSVSSWSQEDVMKWLTKIGLRDKSSLQELTGENLTFLQDLSLKAPEYYCNYVENKLGLTNLNDMMAFCKAIDKL